MLSALISLLASLLGLLTAVPFFRELLESLLVARLGPFSKEDIRRIRRCYIRPDCQCTDPAYTDGRTPPEERDPLFETITDMLDTPDRSRYRYILLLGDSGTGKSAFLVNFFAHRFGFRYWLKYQIRIVPLGMRNPEAAIERIPHKGRTVLFLDALDEDPAIWEREKEMVPPGEGQNDRKEERPALTRRRHWERIRELCEQAREFRNVLITCRTQFFPREEEVPDKPGVVKIGPQGGLDNSKEFVFEKRYLSLFSDKQVESFLTCKFPDKPGRLREQKRAQARRLVDRIPDLTCRPLILSYIEDLLRKDPREYRYSFQLFETIIDAWLRREVGVAGISDPEELRKFSERLAIDIFTREQTSDKSGLPPYEEVDRLAGEYGIRLDGWQLTGRSLLNRGADDGFKFAHRSLMEYLYVRRWLFDLTPETRPWVQWTNQMRVFVRDMLRHRYAGLLPGESLESCLPAGAPAVEALRLQKKRFVRLLPPSGKAGDAGTAHPDVETLHVELAADVVLDLHSGLLWERSGSDEMLTYEAAHNYVRELNERRFSGYRDWRLPTMPELLTLLEAETNEAGYYIHPVFDRTQRWIWTADRHSASAAWYVGFSGGYCGRDPVGYHFHVRAVRSGQSVDH